MHDEILEILPQVHSSPAHDILSPSPLAEGAELSNLIIPVSLSVEMTILLSSQERNPLL